MAIVASFVGEVVCREVVVLRARVEVNLLSRGKGVFSAASGELVVDGRIVGGGGVSQGVWTASIRRKEESGGKGFSFGTRR